jgi:hypothetical protein
MRRTTVYCVVLALMLMAFLVMACDDTPQTAYCDLQPKPLICP